MTKINLHLVSDEIVLDWTLSTHRNCANHAQRWSRLACKIYLCFWSRLQKRCIL